MPMSEPNRIDIASEDPERGKLLLVITEHRPWDDSGLMDQQFRAKIKAYTDYIRGPQITNSHPGFGPHDVIIQLGCRVAPSARALALFEQARQELARHGIGFEYVVMKRPGEQQPPSGGGESRAVDQPPAAPPPRRPWWRFWG
jgi:hypothetical protein